MIYTERLVVRPFLATDFTDLFAYLSLPETYRFEPGAPITIAEARTLAAQRAQGNDFWAVVLQASATLIGHIYFKQIEPPELFTWEIGYIFHPGYQHQGYATEAAKGLLNFALNAYPIHRVMARCNPENSASWQLLERIGLRREAHLHKNIFFHRDEAGLPCWQDTFEYALLREEGRYPIKTQKENS